MRSRFLIFTIYLLFSRTIYASTPIATYTDIINKTPSNWKARFELAQLYFESKNFSAAQYNFEFVRANNSLSKKQIGEIDQFLSQIRMQKKWDIEFGIGAIPDASERTPKPRRLPSPR